MGEKIKKDTQEHDLSEREREWIEVLGPEFYSSLYPSTGEEHNEKQTETEKDEQIGQDDETTYDDAQIEPEENKEYKKKSVVEVLEDYIKTGELPRGFSSEIEPILEKLDRRLEDFSCEAINPKYKDYFSSALGLDYDDSHEAWKKKMSSMTKEDISNCLDMATRGEKRWGFDYFDIEYRVYDRPREDDEYPDGSTYYGSCGYDLINGGMWMSDDLAKNLAELLRSKSE